MTDNSPTDPNESENSSVADSELVDDHDSADDISLEMLGRFYAQAMAKNDGTELSVPLESLDASTETDCDRDLSSETDSSFPITPKSILEAMLFVGSEDDGGLTARKAAGLIRGVSPTEIGAMVVELNAEYQLANAAYRIVETKQGFQLTLVNDLESVRSKMYGRIREARLSNAAIEVLAVVAYNQPVTSEAIDVLRNRSSGPILNQLVRRELIRVERDPENRRVRQFTTSEKFLELFGLEGIEDLPQAHLDNELEFLDQ